MVLILSLAIALVASGGGWLRLAGTALVAAWILTVVSLVDQFRQPPR